MTPALLTDLYELTMVSGYVEAGRHEEFAVFDLFFRTPPFQGSYCVAAGLESALDYLETLHFTDDDLRYLYKLQLFSPPVLDYLRTFRFQGTVRALPEGSLAFPNEPLLTVEGALAQVQLVESALLNIVNFQSLIATKASRIVQAAAPSDVVEFGLRRAQGPDGAMSEARAAYIGGARTTSNTAAGACFDIPVTGTMAHSWVMSFDSELESFRRYAATYPDQCVLLLDTYDTIESGLPNALRVAQELRQQGHELRGVRLDSGDLAPLSRQVREYLDSHGFPEVKIVASNELDEVSISAIRQQGGCIDIYGVGTKLATGTGPGGGALGGIYKLVQIDERPRLKRSSDLAKSTMPGRKEIFRAIHPDGRFAMDILALASDTPQPGDWVVSTAAHHQPMKIPDDATVVPQLEVVMREGRRVKSTPSLGASADRCTDQLRALPDVSRRLNHPEPYPVALTEALHTLRTQLIEDASHEGATDR